MLNFSIFCQFLQLFLQILFSKQKIFEFVVKKIIFIIDNTNMIVYNYNIQFIIMRKLISEFVAYNCVQINALICRI